MSKRERRKTYTAPRVGKIIASGFGAEFDPDGLTRRVFAYGERIHYDFAPNVNDQGIPGQYYASHAEKKFYVAHPGTAIPVTREMCDDCVRFFKKAAKFEQKTIVVHETDTGLSRIFRQDTSVRTVGPAGVGLEHPGGGAYSAAPSGPARPPRRRRNNPRGSGPPAGQGTGNPGGQ
jgi:hypothetical protein